MTELSADSVNINTGDIQSQDDGEIPISALQFSPCKLAEVSTFIKQHHYSHTYPGGVEFAFKLTTQFVPSIILGACLFGWMAGNPKAVHVPGYHPKQFRELMRLVILDHIPKNSESRFIGYCIRWLKKNTNIAVLVSFADPKFNHSGIVYKASNWTYLGMQKPDRPRMIIDGLEIHPRQCYDKFGTSSKSKIEALGHIVQLTYREPKHKYIYILRNPDSMFGIK